MKNYIKMLLIPLLLVMIMAGCEDRPGINSPLITDCTVTLSLNPSAGGTTSGGGTFNTGSTVTVTATANAGYTFTNWTENGIVLTSSISYQFTISGNRTLVANFTAVAPTQNTVTLSSTPSAGGTTSGSGAFNSGSSVTVTATANTGYTFTNWTENGIVVTSSISYQFTISGNRTLVANFTAVASTQNTVTLSSIPSAGGTTSGGGAFNSGSSVTLTATANTGYTFTNWTENGTVVSTNASYTFTISGNRTLVANFAINTYTLTTTSVNGTVTKIPNQTNYNYGSNVTLTATPSTGYTFTGWSGDATGSTNPLTVTMNGNKNIIANFATNTYTLTITSVNGTVTRIPNQTNYNHGSTALLTATPAPGYTFTGWSGDETGSTNPLTVTMNSNKNITANFASAGTGGQASVVLGIAARFAILSNSAITNIPTSAITGDVGISPGARSSIAGLTIPEVTGTIFAADDAIPVPAMLIAAKNDALAAYLDATAAVRGTPTSISGNINGLTLTPGLYESGTSIEISPGGILYLDAQGNTSAVFVIRSATSITTQATSEVRLTNGAQASNIYWVAGSAVTLGTNSIMKGTIIASTSISLLTGARLDGRALIQGAAAGQVSLDNGTIVRP